MWLQTHSGFHNRMNTTSFVQFGLKNNAVFDNDFT